MIELVKLLADKYPEDLMKVLDVGLNCTMEKEISQDFRRKLKLFCEESISIRNGFQLVI